MTSSFKQVFAAILLGACALPAVPAFAQSDPDAMRLLKRLYEKQGYTIESARREGGVIEAITCRDGKRATVTTSLGGDVIRLTETGSCTPPKKAGPEREAKPKRDPKPQENVGFTPQQAQTYLKNQGFEQIELYRENGRLQARACGDNRVHRFTVGRDGSIRSVRTKKRCRSSDRSETVRFNPAKIEGMLQREGFDRIAVLQRKRAPYVARACRGRNRVELTIGRQGNIRDQKRVDGCAPPIDPNGLGEFLRQKGYDRINVVANKSLPYKADVCQRRDRLRVFIGKYGEIERTARVGRCAGTLSEAGLRELLSRRGLIALSVDKRQRGWSADVCDGNKRVALRIGSRGRIRGEEVTGNCRSQTVREVLETLEDRGADRVSAFVEGCFKGKRYRWEFDRLGNRTGRERVGSCR